jgi:hypothetical protein
MAVTVTESKVASLNTIATVTSNAATADVDGTAEVFTIGLTGDKAIIIIGGTGSGADGDITYSFAAGDLAAAKAITGTVTKNTEAMVRLNTAKVLSATGTIVVTLTPHANDKLLTDHAAYVKYVEML